jgi:hypothetical protein
VFEAYDEAIGRHDDPEFGYWYGEQWELLFPPEA